MISIRVYFINTYYFHQRTITLACKYYYAGRLLKGKGVVLYRRCKFGFTPWTIRPPAHAAGSCVRASLQHGGCLAHLHRLIMSRLTHLPAAADDSDMIDLNFTMVIINSAVDNYWHDISGETHPIYFILPSLKEQLLQFAKLFNAGP